MKIQILSVLTIVCIIVTICFVAQGSQKPAHRWKVEPKAHGIAMVNVNETGEDIAYTIRNVSGKVITAFAISFTSGNNDRINHYEDWFGAEGGALGIHQEYTFMHGKEMIEGMGAHNIIIGAVIYEDGEQEGSQDLIDSIEGKRLGKMLEVGRIVDIVTPAAAKHKTNRDIDELAKGIGILPGSAEEAQPLLAYRANFDEFARRAAKFASRKYQAGFLSGVRTAREDAMRHIDKLRTLPEEFDGTGKTTKPEYIQKIKNAFARQNEIMRINHQKASGGKEK